jgi:biopolymer transport protein ExbD
MGGIDIGGGGGGGRRRTMDSEINMIPMIDLLMVTISFLLITAVWTHMARIDANAQVPALRPEVPPDALKAEKQLHVMMQKPEKFVLVWKQGNVTVDSIEVPRHEVVVKQGASEVVRYPELAQKIESEWKAKGQHSNPADRTPDQAVLHTDDKTEFEIIVGVMDAIDATRRDVNGHVGAGPANKPDRIPAFNITFAVD